MTYHPWRDLLSRSDVTLLRVRLPKVGAAWLRRPRVIVIDPRCTRAEARSHLAHELVHVDLDDVGCSVQSERRADQIAARRLIPLDALVAAMQWASHSEYVIADELNVDVRMVRARLEGLDAEEMAELDRRVWRDARDTWGAA